ncbi:carbon catabolite repressor protein 4 homolog 1-like isoform X2 [Alnus glutinosa]|uniref:carbon catabolite repressor protein 4 homolog 1-like isoform X2 n=1 Tax=Alnus glutinosa TaxID=3517 RepID=UPI002D7697DF|nr:carbon catabolite repressor protein 4 homolog 1-like isoform X2 [Alnus glutinosa]
MVLQESETVKCEVSVTPPSSTPVVGCEINLRVWVNKGSPNLKAPPHALIFSWYREQITCSVHHAELAAVQCTSCVTLNIPVKESYHCSTRCFLDAWKKHLARHHHAAEVISKNLTGNQKSARELRSSGSWPSFGNGSLFDEGEMVVEREGKVWIKVGSMKTYVPTMDDFGFSLRLESVAVDCSHHFHLSPINVIVTDPVILPPRPCHRCMIPIGYLNKPWNSNLKDQSSKEAVFSVLSYNILADLYASRDKFSYCPTWALVWEYRRQNLLREIIEYHADILCLQEVQSDHFESFFKPELANCGYSVLYKKKSKELYTPNQYIIDGCATFYRSDLFKEIKKYELEFDKAASSVVEALEPGLRRQGSFRLMKDNVALVVVLEKLHNGSTNDAFQSRICVANTHIHANPNFPDVKLFQVAYLVNGLETIAQSQIPLLLCGDLNSLPESDPHIFIVVGKTYPIRDEATDPMGIYQHLKLQHSLPLRTV